MSEFYSLSGFFCRSPGKFKEIIVDFKNMVEVKENNWLTDEIGLERNEIDLFFSQVGDLNWKPADQF